MENISPKADSRRKSTGSLGIKSKETSVLPNYLRASVGSCHDICKYGRRRELEMKTLTPIAEISSVSPKKSSETRNLQKQKSLIGISRSLSLGRNWTSLVKEKEIQSPNKKTIVNTKHSNELKLKPVRTKLSSISTAQQPSRKGGSNTPQRSSSFGRSYGINASKANRTRKERKKGNVVPANGSRSGKPDMRMVPKEVSHRKRQRNVSKAETEPGGVENLPEKILHVTEMNSENQVVSLAQGMSLPDHSLQVQSLPSEERDGKNKIQGCSISPQQETEDVAFNDKEIDHIQSSPSSSLSKDNIGSRRRKAKYRTKSPSASPVSFSSISPAAGTDCSPRKLKFRRGKIIDIQNDKSSPRRLKFRQGKVHGENENGNADAWRKSLRPPDRDSKSTKRRNESIRVSLRRQNAEQKGSSGSLYNIVIEETAKKLVQTRKSKVKALVGAFETVISLQDEKSSTTGMR